MILLKCNQEEIIKNRKAISRAASRIGLRNDIMVSLLARNYSEYENNIAYQPFYQNKEKGGIFIDKTREDLAIYRLETAKQCIISAKVKHSLEVIVTMSSN